MLARIASLHRASGAGSRIAVNIPMVMPFRTALPTDPQSSHGISPDIL